MRGKRGPIGLPSSAATSLKTDREPSAASRRPAGFLNPTWPRSLSSIIAALDPVGCEAHHVPCKTGNMGASRHAEWRDRVLGAPRPEPESTSGPDSFSSGSVFSLKSLLTIMAFSHMDVVVSLGGLLKWRACSGAVDLYSCASGSSEWCSTQALLSSVTANKATR
jgi:hypothetical protein